MLTNERGYAIKTASLAAQTNYVFHYPFEATPVFLLDLGKAVLPNAGSLKTKSGESYAWPGGVGAKKSIVERDRNHAGSLTGAGQADVDLVAPTHHGLLLGDPVHLSHAGTGQHQ